MGYEIKVTLFYGVSKIIGHFQNAPAPGVHIIYDRSLNTIFYAYGYTKVVLKKGRYNLCDMGREEVRKRSTELMLGWVVSNKEKM